MEVLYLLIPIALILVTVVVAVFCWAVRSGQFDDLSGPAHRILMDEDERPGEEHSHADKPERHADDESAAAAPQGRDLRR